MGHDPRSRISCRKPTAQPQIVQGGLAWALTCTAFAALLCAEPGVVRADDSRRLQVGMRSALIAGTMKLSDLDSSFDDLDFDGISGAHHSTIFGTYEVRPYLRLGWETLVGNSDEDAETTMDFQAAGPIAELVFRRGRFVAVGGLHLGIMLANAMHRDDARADSGVQAGTFYKSGALFAAPYAGAGLFVGPFELRLFAKYVRVGAGSKANASAFSAPYVGLSAGYVL